MGCAPYTVRVRWGGDDTVAENPESSVREYAFSTERERDAFLLGVDEACGWMEYEILDEDDEDDEDDLPPCAAIMGCLCAFHARGGAASEPCDATE